ncbi:MAG: ribonuclease P protein component [Bacteroidales bacterium]|nr:ribonuclease P protein component [Bacteroidales bacterium]
MGFTFKKEERLCSRQLIDRLYNEGHRLMAFPYSVQWMKVDGPCQVMIVAPKRKFHHAVDRNRVRRLTRECYRLRKHILYQFLEEHGISIVFSMIYIHNEIMPYEQLGHKMDKLLAALEKEITTTL